MDKYWKTHRRTVGPLHGLPITLKDQFHVKGMVTTMAYVGWTDTFEGDKSSTLKYRMESEIVRGLQSLGAVVIAKVRLSQLPRCVDISLTLSAVNLSPKSLGMLVAVQFSGLDSLGTPIFFLTHTW